MIINEKQLKRSIFMVSLLLLIGLQFASINPMEQDRFFYFSIDMFSRGPRFFPYVDGAPYPDYIALVMIMSDALAHLFGHVSVFSVGLPYCIAGALLITYTYALGALHDRRLGLLGAYFCLLCWKFLDSVSALDLDLFPALSTVICVYLAHKNALQQQKPPLLRFVLLWVFGYFCRGPIGLLVPAMITGLYYFTNRDWKISAYIALLSASSFVLTGIILLYMAYITGGDTFMKEVMAQQGVGRIVNEHAPRYYFFFTIGILDYAFTSFFAILVATRYLTQIIRSRFDDHAKKLLLFCLQWSAIIILFFTLPATKKARYIMPLVPAISLMSAYAWIQDELRTIKNRIFFILESIPLLCLVISISCLFLPQETAPYPLLILSLISISCQYCLWRTERYMLGMLVIALVQILALHLFIIEPMTLKSLSRSTMVPWF